VLSLRIPATPNFYDVLWKYEEAELWFFTNQKSANEELETQFSQSFGAITTAGTVGVSGEADIIGASLSADLAGGFSVRLNYSQLDADVTITTTTGTGTTSFVTAAGTLEWDHYAIGVAYAVDNFIVEANYGQFDATVANSTASADVDADGFGLAVNYDIGGGAVVMAGYGSGEDFAGNDEDIFSIGLGLSF
jgi:outer membrane protein OmpU